MMDAVVTEKIIPLLEEKFGAKVDAKAKWDSCVVLDKENLHAAVELLKNEFQMDMLLDLAGIDYLTYPNYEGPRFAISYAFKSMANPGRRIRLKVLVSEADLKVQTVTDLYKVASWLEREVFDQYGIVFAGHKDLRRILNHHEFVGHPLRKDYPATRRQWLSENDYLVPELEKRLVDLGYKVVQRSEEINPCDNEYLEGSIQNKGGVK